MEDPHQHDPEHSDHDSSGDDDDPPARDALPKLVHENMAWRWRHHKWRIVGRWTDSDNVSHKISCTADITCANAEDSEEMASVLQSQLARRIARLQS